MKFVHVGDTHLGKTEARILEREKDFYSSFKQVIDKSVSENVDFVIHSGDLFDVARPPTRTLIFVVEQLSRLKEKGIPMFIVPGSHDMGVEDTMLSVFDRMGLLKNLASNRYYKHDNDKIIVNGESYKGCFICGVAGRRANIDKIYQQLKVEDNSAYKIFVFHHIISDISERFSDIPSSVLPKDFDYYAGGHWHGYFQTKFGKGDVVYPGSTDYNDLNEIENDPEKYFCIAEVNDGKTTINKVPITTRKIVSLNIDCSNLTPKEVTARCIEKIEKTSDNPILILKLNGRLSNGTKSEINRNLIFEHTKASGYLFTKTYIGELENPNSPFISTKKRSASEIEEEYLLKQNYDENTTRVAKQLINILGKKLTPTEFEKRKNIAIEIIRGFLLEDKKPCA